MFKIKVFIFFMAIKNMVAPCYMEKGISGFRAEKMGYKIEKVGQLPDSIPESSGLEIAQQGKSFWTHGDGGCKKKLYEINQQGEVLSVLSLKKLSNIDWEDIAKDDQGNLYIADIGNNRNIRKNLYIFKINVNEKNSVDTIKFSYPDQNSFPPSKEQMNFDCESIFWYKDSLYLFSKNRGQKCVKFYKLPDKGGEYVAELFQEVYMNSMVTAADISPDNKMMALLTYGKIYFFKIGEGDKLIATPYFCKTFSRNAQAEALVFINNTDLLVSNEQGKLFLVSKKKKSE
jgi:hypothetical protein